MQQVNDFVSSQAPMDEATSTHANKMESWLGKLEQQIASSWPKKPKTDLPDALTMYAWADEHCNLVLKDAVSDMQMLQTLRQDTAYRVEMAAVVMLAVGSETPPCRLNLIKSWSTNPGCTDPDCLARQHGQTCAGNRLVLVQHQPGELEADPEWDGILGYGTTSIRSEVRHGKTDRSARSCFIQYTLPRGNLSKLLLLHIKLGHGVLTFGTDSSQLMVTRPGNAFSDSGFTAAFRGTIAKCSFAQQAGLQPFAPNQARAVFVEDYTADRYV